MISMFPLVVCVQLPLFHPVPLLPPPPDRPPSVDHVPPVFPVPLQPPPPPLVEPVVVVHVPMIVTPEELPVSFHVSKSMRFPMINAELLIKVPEEILGSICTRR